PAGAGPRVVAGAPSQVGTPSHIVQPPMGRSGGPPQSARAQMGGMRGMIGNSPPIGTAAHFGGSPAMAAPRMSGGARGGGGRSGGGFHRH
ncbi:MAG: SH3 domain-containing protein, partial [Bradyrhizobium sp.]